MGHKGETLTGADVTFSRRDSIAIFTDIRTTRCAHVTPAVRDAAFEATEVAYVKFAAQCVSLTSARRSVPLR